MKEFVMKEVVTDIGIDAVVKQPKTLIRLLPLALTLFVDGKAT